MDSTGQITDDQANPDANSIGAPHEGEIFDPDTLANLAALSRMEHNEGSDEDADGEDVVDGGQEDFSALFTGRVTREQVQDFVNGLGASDRGTDEDKAEGEEEKEDGREERDGTEDVQSDENESDGDDEGRSESEDGENLDPKYVFEGGKLKRRRNRTTLWCDRNIPCSRCVKRGVPSMCRMETPILPQRKKRRLVDNVPINYELGLRVQALETLIRSGSNMDAEAASTAAMETILHATRAANSGSQDANSALAQLTQSGVGSMSQDAQSNLLMDVLQQLSVASTGRTAAEPNGNATESNAQDAWSSIPSAPAESSSRISSSFEEDPDPGKLDLTLHGFREDNGRIFMPPTVRYALKSMRNENILARQALPIEGESSFLDLATKLAYGADSVPYRSKRISAIQAISLTGALRLAATFLARFPASAARRAVYVPSPTTEEDTTALREAGLDVRPFSYLDRKNGGVDFEGVREDLQAAPPRSVVMLHVSGSMSTGADFGAPQWRQLATILQERQLIPLIIMASQGLSSGDPNRDAQPVRFMVHEGLAVVLVQSFDAMMGLYADSPATVSIPTPSSEAKKRVDSRLRAIARGMYLHPSPWGAHVVHAVLSDPKLLTAWLAETKAMADRLRSIREKLYNVIANKLKTPGSWHHIKRSTGMFCSTLFTASQTEALSSQRHIYLLPEGCFSLGCLNASKVDTLARGIDYIVREGIREAEGQASQNVAMELALAAAKEQQAREEAEAAAAAAREEDTLLMERSIASAMEAQKRAEDDEKQRQVETRDLEESSRKAAERAEIARKAEAILATIQTRG